MNIKSVFSTAFMWRVLRFPLVRIAILGSIIVFLMGKTTEYSDPYAGTALMPFIITAGMVLVALAFYIAYGRFIERRPVSEFAFAGMGWELGLGCLIGAGLYTVSVLILIAFGVYRIEGFNAWTFILPAVAMALSSGVFEELLFRGVLFRSLEDLFGSWASLIISASVFGFAHLINPEATVTGAIYISIEAGLLLAAAFMLTRRLWLSIGFHVSWNYTQSAIFSGIVSGNEPQPGLIRSNIQGPEILTGGSFGLESSIVAFTLCTTVGLILLVIAHRRGTIVPPLWKRP